jgi:hypothetical protein
MATQYGGDLYDFPNMSDDEIREVIVEHLREYPNLDAGWIDVDVRDGFVTLSGRVGTDSEVQVAESVLDDVLGLDNYSNELVVDELHRGELSEAADEAVVQSAEVDDQEGDRHPQQSDTADHLEEDLDSQTYGTHDMGEAIREGTPYTPPDRPVADGYDSRETH